MEIIETPVVKTSENPRSPGDAHVLRFLQTPHCPLLHHTHKLLFLVACLKHSLWSTLGFLFRARFVCTLLLNLPSPSLSKRVNTTSVRWSESSTWATVLQNRVNKWREKGVLGVGGLVRQYTWQHVALSCDQLEPQPHGRRSMLCQCRWSNTRPRKQRNC